MRFRLQPLAALRTGKTEVFHGYSPGRTRTFAQPNGVNRAQKGQRKKKKRDGTSDHVAPGCDNSRRNQTRAVLHSRLTVVTDTLNSSAISTPKNRSSTMRACRGSSSASAASASSKATRSGALQHQPHSPRPTRVPAFHPAPCVCGRDRPGCSEWFAPHSGRIHRGCAVEAVRPGPVPKTHRGQATVAEGGDRLFVRGENISSPARGAVSPESASIATQWRDDRR